VALEYACKPIICHYLSLFGIIVLLAISFFSLGNILSWWIR
jgi:hypothetical protein